MWSARRYRDAPLWMREATYRQHRLGLTIRRPRCRSFRFRGGRFVRCTWERDHVSRSKWHCSESTTGHVWLVRDRERPPEFWQEEPNT